MAVQIHMGKINDARYGMMASLGNPCICVDSNDKLYIAYLGCESPSPFRCIYYHIGYEKPTDLDPRCRLGSCPDAGGCKKDTEALKCIPYMEIEELPGYLIHEVDQIRLTAQGRLEQLKKDYGT